MPQFDSYSFLSQLFWAFAFFLTFYFIFLRNILPKMAMMLKVRQALIDNNQTSTSHLQDEVDSVESRFDGDLSAFYQVSRNSLTQGYDMSNTYKVTSVTGLNESAEGLYEGNDHYIKHLRGVGHQQTSIQVVA